MPWARSAKRRPWAAVEHEALDARPPFAVRTPPPRQMSEPGVAEVRRERRARPRLRHRASTRAQLYVGAVLAIAGVVLGLADVDPEAALPVLVVVYALTWLGWESSPDLKDTRYRA